MRKIINLSDDRKLSYIDIGDKYGKVVIYFHGVPSAATDFGMWANENKLRDLNIRLISVDRPGTGLSTYDPNRTLSSFAKDISELTNILNIDKFSVMGYSGGGPYAMSCAALLKDKVASLILVSSVVSFDKENLLEGLNKQSTNFLKLSINMPHLFRFLYFQLSIISKIIPKKLYLKIVVKNFSKRDAEVFSRPSVHDTFFKSKGSPKGQQLDAKLVISPWDFKFQDIQIPTYIWQGEKDNAVSVGMSEYLKQNIKNSNIKYFPNEGHISLIVNNCDEILRKSVYN